MNKPCEHCDKADKKKSDYFKCDCPCYRAKLCYKNDRIMLDILGKKIEIMEGGPMYIKPRKTSDTVGYLCMPLRVNVPRPIDKTWKLTTCTECGCECWDSPLPEGFTDDMFSGKLCTMCALKKG